MGTNYYVHNIHQICECCGLSSMKPLHIGKSSFGWAFSLNTHPDMGLDSLESWVDFLADNREEIYDEYGQQLSLGEMICKIVDRGGANRRAPVDGEYILKNGNATYQLHRGEFS